MQWIRENYPNWPAGSYYIIYETMPRKDGFVHSPEPPWVGAINDPLEFATEWVIPTFMDRIISHAGYK